MTGKQPGSPTPYDIEDTDELLKLDLRAFAWGFLCIYRARRVLTCGREGALVSNARVLEALSWTERVRQTDYPPGLDDSFRRIRRLGERLRMDYSHSDKFIGQVLEVAALIDRLLDDDVSL